MLGLREHSQVVILGGGPAGISAGVWCRDLGLDAVILERESGIGGQLNWTFNSIKNYPGIAAENGAEMLEKFAETIAKYGIEPRQGVDITHVDLSGGRIETVDGGSVTADFVIIATGVRRRRLGVAGEDAFRGRGIIESGAASKEAVAGRRVVIIGGGDAAFENALILAETAAKVSVINRRSEVTARPEFVTRVGEMKNVEIFLDSHVAEIGGSGTVEYVAIANQAGNRRIDADAVLIRIGVEPNTENFRGPIDLDAEGFVVVDQLCRTTMQDVYAIGDVASPWSPTIATAVGMGATAVKTIAKIAR